ncbi:hypothetical protein [Stenotrophomonas rhizophila]|uniref:hypothetical protein n=1 Tax=Stenotrophomonas rhizophila TaxID=216778 RepID=UPI001AEC3447|nr:hypothetical protein [Stenotrophomonas rhizophila]
MIKPGKGYRPALQRWIAVLVIAAALAVGLRGIAKDVHFDGSLLGQVFIADAGWTQSVPPEVVEARQLLAQHHDGNLPVALGPGLKKDPLLQQRLWEGLYPTRLHDAAHGRILWNTPGPQQPGCLEIARSERIVLVDCP